LTAATKQPQQTPAPVIEDLSTYLVCGRNHSADIPRGIHDGVVAERLGFRRVWLSERYDLKEAGAFLGGVAALTSHLEVATGAIAPGSRHPMLTAALGATMQAAYGERFILGLGRGVAAVFGRGGMKESTYDGFVDYADIVKRLWRRETVTYDGPAGRFEGLRLIDPGDERPPEIWAVVVGGPKACKAVASPAFDGVMLSPYLTAEAVHGAVTRIGEACEAIGRDPATLRICHPIVTAPELDEFETHALCHARAVTYLDVPQAGDTYMRLNGWEPDIVHAIRSHTQVLGSGASIVDQAFHRAELVAGAAKLVPDSWMRDTCAIGSVRDCVDVLQSFRDAGVDELAFYGSTPEQNAGLVAAWRDRSGAQPTTPASA
jgi:5,10-methylenetetrahydromethanopterin reductase